jgi:hypothetical protein
MRNASVVRGSRSPSNETRMNGDLGRPTQALRPTQLLNCPAKPLGERVYGSGHDETEQRKGNGRLHEHCVLGAVGQWHHVGWAECGRVRETQV